MGTQEAWKIKSGEIIRPVRETRFREQILDGGATMRVKESIETGRERVWYDVTVNLTDLEAMAHQAARNKSGRSVDGAVTVRVTRRLAL